jgi:hypothetical protein
MDSINSVLEDIICNTITIFFSCIVMFIADLCVLFIAATATFLFGQQTYIIPLETLMFMISAAVGTTYIIESSHPASLLWGD